MEKFKRDVRTYFLFKDEINDERLDTYNPKLYVKNTRWTPPLAKPEIELRLTAFQEELTKAIHQKNLQHKYSSNLSRVQEHAIKTLKNNENFIITLTDKNLGPAILRREQYIKLIYDEHLSDIQTYQRKDEIEINSELKRIHEELLSLIHKYKETLPEADFQYLKRTILEPPLESHRVPQFYGMPKVHKKGKLRTRPVISQIGSLLAKISTYINFQLQKLRSLVPTYIQRSEEVKKELEELGEIPPNSKLFTIDATSMYTNIDPVHGIQTLEDWFQTHRDKIPIDIPKDFLFELIKITLHNNYFQFGNTFWLQTLGIAMGTPMACILATLYFGFYEKTYLFPKYSKNLVYCKRQIDDILGIWVDDPDNPTAWTDYLRDINAFGKLRWNLEAHGTEVNFLDITISINSKNRIETKTFQKSMNLFLYIPPTSAHPPGIAKGLIHGSLQKYWKQNTKTTDFQHITKLFFQRLLARGHNPTLTRQLFIDAAKKMETSEQKTDETDGNNNKNKNKNNIKQIDQTKIFFHRQFHPKDISRRQIQTLFQKTCIDNNEFGEGFRSFEGMHIDRMVVAYSKPKNIRDLIIPSKLFESSNVSASAVIARHNQEGNKKNAHG